MPGQAARAIAIVGVGAVLPDAPDARTYLENLKTGRYSISEVPSGRWSKDLYYDSDPSAPRKTYSTVGGWVTDYEWDPLGWRLPLPPKVSDAMDRTQKWAIVASREALSDYGYPERALDADRTAVVFGNAMGGEQHYLTTLPIYFPEYAEQLKETPSFAALDADVRDRIVTELGDAVGRYFPPTTEDTMPGELGNIVAGRVANLFNLHGPNFITDAACASALAAIDAAIEGLENEDYDAVLTGGIDANMGINSFVKFCKIGALSATGTRPYHDGADGFVMGEGAAVFLLKRLADAERDDDHIYAVIRGIGGSSDGKGKGITAPNPVGQEFAVARGWRNAGITPDTASYIEGHGTSTKVGDVVEFEALSRVFADLGLKPGSIPLGSVKSNIGHLKAAAGSAGLLKAAWSLDQKLLFPTLGDTAPNPRLDFDSSPLYISKELTEWKTEPDQVRSAGVSAFGFGGTNFHVVLEEYVPGRIVVEQEAKTFVLKQPPERDAREGVEPKAPLRGALLVGAEDEQGLLTKLRTVLLEAEEGIAPEPMPPAAADLGSRLRIAIDYGDAAQLAAKTEKAITAIESGNETMWKALHNQGVFMGSGPPPIVAFLYTGQGSQYVNMLAELRETEPIVAEMFDEADVKMSHILGNPLTEYIYVDGDDKEALAEAEAQLRNTEITQPAVLSVDLALTRLLGAYGIRPAMVMGHSLGEYGALVAAGAMPFPDSLEAVAGRGREMSKIKVEDKGLMAAVFAPIEEVESVVQAADGYVVVANKNSNRQSVIGGATDAVEAASKTLSGAGHHVIPLSVSHAFHTEIVSPASEPLKRLLSTLELRSAEIPIVANVTGEFYPRGPDVTEQMVNILGRQVASPVQFVKGLETLYEAGARMFVEVGPKRALQGFVSDVFGDDNPDVQALATNHPRQGDIVSFNHALCGLYAAGLGTARDARPVSTESQVPRPLPPPTEDPVTAPTAQQPSDGHDVYSELGRLFADFLERGNQILSRTGGGTSSPAPGAEVASEPVVITGAALGLPGRERVFSDDNVSAILHGEQFIDTIPVKYRRLMTEKHITRLVKSEEGGGRFEDIESQSDVIKLAGRAGELDLVEEFGFPSDRLGALDRTSSLAIGAGLDALRDAGIPLTLHYKTTTTGSKLPERWMLPEAYRDTTGVIFASAFPAAQRWVEEVERFDEFDALHTRLEDLKQLQTRAEELGANTTLSEDLARRVHELEREIADHEYHFDRKFLYQALSFGHAQFAEYIGARGPNTQLNAACASTTQAVAVAEDWIRTGRCDRVVIVSGDDVTTEHMIEWIGSGFLAMGAAATDEVVEEAATPFDRRRHGLILGMGAAGLIVESLKSATERSIRPISEVLSTVTANSAFHGSRLDTDHIRFVMDKLVTDAERRWGIDRHQIAPHTVFISHETYTPARGGSAQAEIDALRHVFGDSADRIVISNTKGFTGHAMGAGIEDVVAVKALETGMAPPIPNFEEPDPDLGRLNLSKGGSYPIEYALRLGAGFGSQVSLSLLRRVPSATGAHQEPDNLGFEYRIEDEETWQRWLADTTGLAEASVEVVKRTLRVQDQGAPTAAPKTPAKEPMRPEAVATAAPSAAPEPVAIEPEAEPAAADDEVTQTVLAIVSEQTGYPPDMLDLDLDLEADLGVDTVKQAETFAAIRERYGIERDDSLALRDYPTLQHVVGFVYERAEGLTQPTTTQPAPEPEAVAADDIIVGDDEAAAAIPRRVPTAQLRPALESCVETGVELDSARVIVMVDQGGVGKALTKKLEKGGAEVLTLTGAPSAEELLEAIDQFAETGPVTGVYWLPALDVEGALSEMDHSTWKEELRVRVKLLYATMRHLYDVVGGPGTFLLSATRMGGRHGYDDAGATAPMGGAVSGFTKAYHREKPDALTKVVDFPTGAKPALVADTLIEETLWDPGAVEIGRTADRRWTVGLSEETLPEAMTHEMGDDPVFVITGAAGSIVSAITADLARAYGGTFHLLDLVELPTRDDPDVTAFSTDKDALKQSIFERLKSEGEKATPVAIEKVIAGIERRHAARSAVDSVEAAGGRVEYHQVNLLDDQAVRDAAETIRGSADRVDLVLHAGGLEISKRLPDKEPSEYDLVFDVKADGWFSLIAGLGDIELGATVVFSSVAGRFGNDGQTDYSAANDLLCKMTSNFKTTRPATLGVAIDWTAWGDIGMATRGSIPTIMKAAGIDMLPARAGIPIVRREVSRRHQTGEVVIGQRLGVLADETHDTGGFDVSNRPSTGLLDRVDAFGVYSGLRASVELDPKVQPFLFDHRIDDTPVLPGVMGMELFAEAALLGYPDLNLQAIEDVSFNAPFKFYRDEPREVVVEVWYTLDDEHVIAHCRLIGVRALANQPDPQRTVHFEGRVRLGANKPTKAKADPPTVAAGVDHDDVYAIYFHGPAYQVVESAWREGEGIAARLTKPLPANHTPEDRGTVTMPRLAELCFQTAGVLGIASQGTMALPTSLDRVTFADVAAKDGDVFSVARRGEDGNFSCTVVDDSGAVLVSMTGYRTIELPGAVDDSLVEPLRTALESST